MFMHMWVAAVSCKQKNTKNRCDLDLKIQQVLEVVEVHVRAKFHQAKCSGSRVIVFTVIGYDAENNTALASVGSNQKHSGNTNLGQEWCCHLANAQDLTQLLSVNGKESSIMTTNPQKNMYYHQKLNTSSFGHANTSMKFYENLSVTF